MDPRFPNRKPATWFFKQELGITQNEFTVADALTQEESGTVSERNESPAREELGGFVSEPQINLPSETDEDVDLPSYEEESSSSLRRVHVPQMDSESSEGLSGSYEMFRFTEPRHSPTRRQLLSNARRARQTDDYLSSCRRCVSWPTYPRVCQLTSFSRTTFSGLSQTGQTMLATKASTLNGAGFDTLGRHVNKPDCSASSSDDNAAIDVLWISDDEDDDFPDPKVGPN